ncbi:WD40 repeat-like protein [Gonapodya prolifera JEL478]|uniref:WD40 repeat-like protein n=1 Tax=Gonapodya prolifera (strain JEL478) TaxID=1344416 RepID=A0A139APN0_GONPJ|nr:WD40 repeat-like protein [Gonapodya prolifera JEL478]|eukprot:KXS18604.1 WD40 repeat-like protein [Gonapodya prolifera JEL478]
MDPNHRPVDDQDIENDDDVVYLDDGEGQEVVEDDGDVAMDSDDEDGAQEPPEGEDNGEEEQENIKDDSVAGFLGHNGSVFCVALSPTDQTLAVSGGEDDKAYVWRTNTGQPSFELSGHTDSVIAAAFSNDGKYVATGGMDGLVKVWSTSDGKLVQNLQGPSEVTWNQWHPRGPVILAGTSDGSLWMWNAPTGSCMSVFTGGHAAPVSCGMFTPDGKAIVSGSEDGSFVTWDPKNGQVVRKLSPGDARWHSGTLTCVDVKADATVAGTGSEDGTAKLVHLGNGKILGSFEGHSDSVEAVGFSPTLPVFATGSLDGSLKLWDVQTMRLRHTLSHDDGITHLAWHSSSPLITTSSTDRTVRVWDARSGSCERTWTGHRQPILDFAITRDGSSVVTASDDWSALVFRM